MIVNKQIIIQLLFEHYKATLANFALEDLAGDQVIFDNDICLHGCNVFDVVMKMMGVELTNDNYDHYYFPFFEITQKDLKSLKQVEDKIEKYYHWLENQA